jgi:D-erythrulose 1-phosphate 3-epimerase
MKAHLGVNTIYAAKRWPEPEVWGQHVGERWGLTQVQFCYDLLDPRMSLEARSRMAAEVKQAARQHHFSVHNCFIGGGAYAYNLLLHPFSEFRQDARRWCELATDTAVQLGALGSGGPIAAASVRDASDPAKREVLLQYLVEGLQQYARYAAAQGQQFILWEPSPIGREMLISIDEGHALYARLNQGSPIPIHYCLDVGHQCGYEMRGADLDTYKWLEELGRYSPVLHLQQTDGLWDRHWAFTEEHNREGIIRMDKVLAALERSGLQEVCLFAEIIHAFEFEEEKLLAELDETFAYLKREVGPTT